ncbi:MAG: hypothetical protein R3D71_02920 [Rickettsiales bacterium]
MHPEQTEIITPKTVNFPETAKQEFIAYIKEHCSDDNPYVDFESKRYALAVKMHDALKKVAQEQGNEAKNAKELLEFTGNLRKGRNNPPLLIKNFPVDAKEDLLSPPTNPKDFSHSPPEKTGKKGYITEWALEAFNTLSSMSPIQKKSLQDGRRYHWLIPRKGKEDSKSSYGSMLFELHTEDASHLGDNDMQIMLLGLRNKKTPTILLPLEDAKRIFIKEFSKEELDLLKLPVFKFTPDTKRFQDALPCTRAMLKCNLEGDFTEMQMHGNLDRIKVDQEAVRNHNVDTGRVQALIKKVSNVLAEINQGVILGHGDLLVFDNLRALHSRTYLHEDDRKKGEERHLMRTQSYRDDVVKGRVENEIGASRS